MSREIGRMVNWLRKENNMTLKNLSDKTNLSAGFLSQFERGKTTIAVDSLMLIADALGTSISYLISQDSSSSEEFLHKSYDNSLINQENQRHINLKITNSVIDKDFVPKMVLILPETDESDSEEPFSHTGQEFLYILEGVLTIYMDGKTYDLYPGDTAHYDSSRSHKWTNRTNKVVKMITVHSPNNFQGDQYKK